MFCLQRNFFNPTVPVDEQLFYELVRDKKSNAMIDGFRQSGNAELKRKLPALIFQAMFDETTSKSGKKGAWRKQSATRLTGLVVLDIDHVEHPKELIDEWMSNIDFEKWGILFIYITPSGKGVKVVFKANLAWGNLADNQIEMAKLLGVEADESGKDASRMAFVCKEEDIQFINQELFTYENKEFAEKYNTQYRDGHSNPVNHTNDGTSRYDENHNVATSTSGQVANEGGTLAATEVGELTYHDIPYSQIIEAWLGEEKVKQGDRHRTSLLLADHLRYITDNNPVLIEQILRQTPFVAEIVQERNEDVACTVRSALGYKMYKTLPKRLQDALVKAGASDNSQTSVPNSSMDDGIEQKLWLWGKEIESLFEYYPLLKDVTKGLKQNQFTAALFVSGSLLMTLMTRCTYRFYHRPEELRRLNSSVIIEGDPACGKSFATRLFKLLSKPIAEKDKEGKKAINAYRELMKTKGANKEKPNKPKVVVRIHPARTSNAQFIQDMVNSVEVVDGEEMQLHMLTFDTELDNTLCLQKGGSWIDKISLELKAFHNEEDGQAYSNVDSVLQDFIVTWNYIYTGTPLALKKKVNESNFGSGLATRLTCIPLPSTNFEMLTREVSVDYESDERLKEWAYKLDRTKGELSLRKIIDALFDWTERRMADAAYNESKADEMLLKRCAYHGVNFAAPFIIMRHWNELKKDGEFWCGAFGTDEIDQRLAELIVNIQFACQKHYFGTMAEKYFDDKTRDAAVNRQRQQKTIDAFNRLPEEFTYEDVMRCFNLEKVNTARMRVFRFREDKLIEDVDGFVENGFKKARFRKTGKTIG
ncbi:MAG: hypothetical protein IJ534_01500 [Bacteroidaceae bacterium]|nr:hypothetical protein [Bacteroidaceae bacterium]